MPDDNYQYSLMDEEIRQFEEFARKHRKCYPEEAAKMAEEDYIPIHAGVTFRYFPLNMWPFAKCERCSAIEDIGCRERGNNLKRGKSCSK
jgi:hypothetical protein